MIISQISRSFEKKNTNQTALFDVNAKLYKKLYFNIFYKTSNTNKAVVFKAAAFRYMERILTQFHAESFAIFNSNYWSLRLNVTKQTTLTNFLCFHHYKLQHKTPPSNRFTNKVDIKLLNLINETRLVRASLTQPATEI